MPVAISDVRKAMAELGAMRFGEVSIEEAMHRLVVTTHRIFDVDGAGLMLVDDEDRLRNAAVSDERFEHLEQLQIDLDEGPCITSYVDKNLVCVPNLSADHRWPDFTRAALPRGIRAVLASPIPYNQQAIGVVGVVSEDEHPWSPEGELALLAFTDLAALLIASMLHAEKQTELAGQLQGALDSRAVVEQAKGILMQQQHLSARAAFEQLRGAARAQRRKIGEVAAETINGAQAD